MRILLIILLVIASCSKKPENKFQPIKYHGVDSLATKIIPDKAYQYWAFASLKDFPGYPTKYKVWQQGGDTLLKKDHIENFKSFGLFEGGHPGYRCNFVVTVQNQKINYIKTEEVFRDFLGDIDNYEEAVLLAYSYGYSLDEDRKGSAYRITDDGYQLHLMRYYNYPNPSKEAIQIQVTRNGSISTKSLGIYCVENCY